MKDLPPVVLFDPSEKLIEIDIPDDEPPFTIRRENEVFVVEGPQIEKLLGSVNFDDRDSLGYFQISQKDGVIDALVEKGIKEGDTVRMGEIEFDYVP